MGPFALLEVPVQDHKSHKAVILRSRTLATFAPEGLTGRIKYWPSGRFSEHATLAHVAANPAKKGRQVPFLGSPVVPFTLFLVLGSFAK